MYPNLPSNASDMAYAAANAATLSGIFDQDERRRYGGGMLQRAAPDKGKDDVDAGSDGTITPPASTINKKTKGKKKASPQDSVIDPALSGDAGTPKSDSKDPDHEQVWVQNMRLIEWLRDYVKKRLSNGEFEEENKAGSPQAKTALDTDMTGLDENKDKSEEEHLYPVLRHVEESA